MLAVDGSLALVLGALAALGAWDAAGDRGMRLGVAGVALVGVAAAGLVVRRVWPLAALGLSLAATLAYLALGYPYSPILQLASVAAYTVGAWCPKRVSLTAVAAAVAVYLPVAWSSGGTPGRHSGWDRWPWCGWSCRGRWGRRCARTAGCGRGPRTPSGASTSTRNGCGSRRRCTTWSATAWR